MILTETPTLPQQKKPENFEVFQPPQRPVFKPLNFVLVQKDIEYLITPACEQLRNQMMPSDSKKGPSGPEDILKTYKAVENLIKNKIKVSTN